MARFVVGDIIIILFPWLRGRSVRKFRFSDAWARINSNSYQIRFTQTPYLISEALYINTLTE
jgi:hypothetical protein